jgi:hypothetical protein
MFEQIRSSMALIRQESWAKVVNNRVFGNSSYLPNNSRKSCKNNRSIRSQVRKRYQELYCQLGTIRLCRRKYEEEKWINIRFTKLSTKCTNEHLFIVFSFLTTLECCEALGFIPSRLFKILNIVVLPLTQGLYSLYQTIRVANIQYFVYRRPKINFYCRCCPFTMGNAF